MSRQDWYYGRAARKDRRGMSAFHAFYMSTELDSASTDLRIAVEEGMRNCCWMFIVRRVEQ